MTFVRKYCSVPPYRLFSHDSDQWPVSSNVQRPASSPYSFLRLKRFLFPSAALSMIWYHIWLCRSTTCQIIKCLLLLPLVAPVPVPCLHQYTKYFIEWSETWDGAVRMVHGAWRAIHYSFANRIHRQVLIGVEWRPKLFTSIAHSRSLSCLRLLWMTETRAVFAELGQLLGPCNNFVGLRITKIF